MSAFAPRAAARTLAFQAFAFSGSLLMFSAELMVARAILPSFGAGASVWTTCLLFYQAVLVLGYLWADVLTSRPMTRRRRLAQVIVVVAPFLTFPFQFVKLPLPPALAVLAMLAMSVGLAFFALSTTSILSQRWLAHAEGAVSSDPTFLFGSSNAGALGALLLYPLVIERVLGLRWQQLVWYALYAGFAALHFACMPPAESSREGPARPRVPWAVRAYWMLLAAAGASLLVAASNAATLDASIPLVWMAPLALYLATFIVCFSRRLPSFGSILLAALAGLVVVGAMVPVAAAVPELRQLAVVGMHCAIGWGGGLLCHWSLARARPRAPESLGTFYLALTIGGGLGTALVALVIPATLGRLSYDGIDYAAFAIVIAAALALRVRGAVARAVFVPEKSPLSWAGFGVLGVLWTVFVASAVEDARTRIHVSRTFYGRYSVTEDRGLRRFQHGSTVHGVESTDPARAGEPLGYYHHESPMGRLFTAGLAGPRVGIVGLGVGAIGAYAREGDAWDYYELDPEVEVIARDHFGYLSRARGTIRVVIGDARLMLDAAPDGTYSLLVLDAFSSDFLPAHLVTREAVELYVRKCAAGGIVAFNVSSRAFDFVPELSRIARAIGARAVVAGARDPSSASDANVAEGRFPSRWFVLSRDGAAVVPLLEVGFQEPALTPQGDPWTDDKLDSLRALRF